MSVLAQTGIVSIDWISLGVVAGAAVLGLICGFIGSRMRLWKAKPSFHFRLSYNSKEKLEPDSEPECRYRHDPRARFGVVLSGSQERMVRMPHFLGEPAEGQEWSFSLLDADWPTAAAHLIRGWKVVENRDGILPPPELINDGESYEDPQQVFVVFHGNRFQIVPATIELPDNASRGER